MHESNSGANTAIGGHHDSPPEAILIHQSRERCDPPMSRRQAAAKAGISASQWSDIERGHKQAGSGIAVPIQATAETLARMASVVGVTTTELAAAGREDAARHLTEMNRGKDLRRRIAAVPGLGFIGDQQLASTDGKELLPLIAASLDEIGASPLPAKAKQELTALFVDNLIHDATRRTDELRLILRIAIDEAAQH